MRTKTRECGDNPNIAVGGTSICAAPSCVSTMSASRTIVPDGARYRVVRRMMARSVSANVTMAAGWALRAHMLRLANRPAASPMQIALNPRMEAVMVDVASSISYRAIALSVFRNRYYAWIGGLTPRLLLPGGESVESAGMAASR